MSGRQANCHQPSSLASNKLSHHSAASASFNLWGFIFLPRRAGLPLHSIELEHFALWLPFLPAERFAFPASFWVALLVLILILVLILLLLLFLLLQSWQRKLDPDLSFMDTLKSLLFRSELISSLRFTIDGLLGP